MQEKIAVIKQTLAAFEREPAIDFHHYPITVDFDAGLLTLEGKVKDIAAKKLALELAAVIPLVTGIIDRLKVAAAEPMTDKIICEHVRDALIQESALNDCAISLRVPEGKEVVREPPVVSTGAIEIAVENGDVLLEGQVPSLAHKRLGGVLTWWVPGTQNVLNCLIVEPPEEDNDDELTDAVRLVLEKDPFLNADQIQLLSHNGQITLDGVVDSHAEMEFAVHDAWYVFGVDKVVNKLALRT